MALDEGGADGLLVDLGKFFVAVDFVKVLVTSQVVLLKDSLDEVREDEGSSATPRSN